ncbi:unnamed protein product [Polarella glacialis]|uniref:Alpha-glucosidase n=1 Tax=Polarella glacialis TaxID=89957 RepID=A0A813I5S8_POLGL|nr:unnamed protein product [Polarella glacialis]
MIVSPAVLLPHSEFLVGRSMVKSCCLGVVALVAFTQAVYLAGADDPVADPKAVVVEGKARFTVLTDRLIRCEFVDSGGFVDEPTYAVVNRRLPVPDFKHHTEEGLFDKNLIIETQSFKLQYTIGKPFTAHSLRIFDKKGLGSPWWHFGQQAQGNLFGTVRTLDGGLEKIDLNCSNLNNATDLRLNATEQHCSLGVVSKDGWAVLSDTAMPLWPATGPTERAGARQPMDRSSDIYLFLHGRDYVAAIKDMIAISGKPALPPKYSLGVIFTRWFDFDDDLVRQTIHEFETRSYPLDMFIFDMNWHTHGPWGGYSWAKSEFPSVQGLMRWMRSRGLRMGANIHDADGVRQSEDHFPDFEALVGPSSGDVAFQPTNQSYTQAVDDAILAPLERCDEPAVCKGGVREGFNLWWSDYQQGERLACDSVLNLNPTAVLNKARTESRSRRGERERSLILSRWPGMGGHRSALGFSGDQSHTWEGLRFLPYFTARAANVGFGFWSHDIYGGTIDKFVQQDWELRTRWIQFGALSPVMRFHDKGEGTGACADTALGCSRIWPWDSPTKNYALERRAAVERTELLPYIYTAAWRASETGLALVRPMYFAFSQETSAYEESNDQYFFGDDLVVSPVTTKSSENDGLVSWKLWVPPGEWWDLLDGRFLEGPLLRPLRLDLSEVPTLARANAMLPKQPFDPSKPLGAADRAYGDIRWEAFTYSSGSGQVFEDDGHTTDRSLGKWLLTTLSYSAVADTADPGFKVITARLQIASGGLPFDGCPTARDHLLRFHLTRPAANFSASAGIRVSVEEFPEGLGFIAHLHAVPTAAKTEVVMTLRVPEDAQLATCGQGFMGAARRAQLAKLTLDEANIFYDEKSRGHLQSAAAAVAAVRYRDAAEWSEVVKDFWQNLAFAPDQLDALQLQVPEEPRRQRALALLREAQRLALTPGCASSRGPAPRDTFV